LIKPRQLLHFKGFGGSCLSKTSGAADRKKISPNVILTKDDLKTISRTNPITTLTECMGAGMKTTKAAELQTTKIATRSKGSAASKGQILWQPT
jgi:hypothetical protein